MIYTAHGFHFYKGAPLKNWLLYYPAEKFLAKYTDTLITINQEDKNIAETFHLKKKGQLAAIPGVRGGSEKVLSETGAKRSSEGSSWSRVRGVVPYDSSPS